MTYTSDYINGLSDVLADAIYFVNEYNQSYIGASGLQQYISGNSTGGIFNSSSTGITEYIILNEQVIELYKQEYDWLNKISDEIESLYNTALEDDPWPQLGKEVENLQLRVGGLSGAMSSQTAIPGSGESKGGTNYSSDLIEILSEGKDLYDLVKFVNEDGAMEAVGEMIGEGLATALSAIDWPVVLAALAGGIIYLAATNKPDIKGLQKLRDEEKDRQYQGIQTKDATINRPEPLNVISDFKEQLQPVLYEQPAYMNEEMNHFRETYKNFTPENINTEVARLQGEINKLPKNTYSSQMAATGLGLQLEYLKDLTNKTFKNTDNKIPLSYWDAPDEKQPVKSETVKRSIGSNKGTEKITGSQSKNINITIQKMIGVENYTSSGSEAMDLKTFGEEMLKVLTAAVNDFQIIANQ